MIHAAAKVFLALSALALSPAWGRGAAGACAGQCPRVTVYCPESARLGAPLTFTVEVSGASAFAKLTFNWVVSAGVITTGQGDLSITVDTTGLGSDSVEATVEVGGLPASCARSASCSTAFPRCTLSKVDEYGDISFEDEQARLDNFAVELQNNPTGQGYIIAYGGRRGRAGEAQRRADRARDYLVNVRDADATRLFTVDGGFREDLTVELFIIPTGAAPPTGSPTVDPTEVQTLPDEPETSRPRRGRGRVN